VSNICGWFYCLKIFSWTAINEWIDRDNTALCPYCGIDSVIGSAAGFTIDRGFLTAMKAYWF